MYSTRTHAKLSDFPSLKNIQIHTNIIIIIIIIKYYSPLNIFVTSNVMLLKFIQLSCVAKKKIAAKYFFKRFKRSRRVL